MSHDTFGQSSSGTQFVKPSQSAADSLLLIFQFAAAKNIYGALLKKDPKNQANILQLVTCNMGLRQYDEAFKNVQYYLTLNPTPNAAACVVLYSTLARILSVRNDADKGFEYLKKAVDSGYARLDEFDYETDYCTLRGDEKFIRLRGKAEVNAFPCMFNMKAREFDFMIGEWDVYNHPSTGFNTYVGYNKWEQISGGCAILENWTAVGPPHIGKSINYYDPAKKSWEQVWVGSEGVGAIVQRFLGGIYDKESRIMKFEYDQETASGSKQKHRFRFYNLNEKSVRQLKETSTDGGKTWAVNYDYLYLRRK